MPEPQILYVVTAIVIAGLVGWVAVVLKTAKEPWARPGAATSSSSTSGLKADVPIEGTEEKKSTSEAPPSSSLPKVTAGSASGDADATVDATAVKVEKKDSSASADEKPSPEKPAVTEEKLTTKDEKLTTEAESSSSGPASSNEKSDSSDKKSAS
jgi:hypothetical protein